MSNDCRIPDDLRIPYPADRIWMYCLVSVVLCRSVSLRRTYAGTVRGRDFTVIIPYLYFASWKTLLFLLFITAFSAYCVAVDSQYGMIRIGCVQPISRGRYLCGKSIAIQLHVALFGLVYVASLVLWVGVYAGFSGVSAGKVLAVISVALRTVLLCVGLAGCATAISFSPTNTVGCGSQLVCVPCVLWLAYDSPTRFHLRAVSATAVLLLSYCWNRAGGMADGFSNAACLCVDVS